MKHYIFTHAIPAVLLLGMQQTQAASYWFDNNGLAPGFGVADAATYDWTAGTPWTTDSTGAFSVAGIAWPGGTNQAGLVGAGDGTSYTIRLGATGATGVTLQNFFLNSDMTNAAPIGSGNVAIGNPGDTGVLTINASNSIGAAAGTLTVNNPLNLGASRTLNFRGGTVILNGVVSGTGTSGVNLSGGAGLTSGTLTLANTANTYTGVTTLQAAGFTLAVTQLANGGVSSSIGSSSNAATNLLFSGGTLKFIGTGAQSTDRLFRMGQSGTFLDASGPTAADTMSWTNTGSPTFSAADSARNLTLTGTNTGANTFAGALTNNGTGVNTITKTGPGTWVLSGASTFTGAVTFGTTNGTDGILRLASNGALGTSAGGLVIRGGTQTGGIELTGGITVSDAVTFEGRQVSTQGDFISNLSGNNIVAGLMTGGIQGANYNIGSQAGLIDFQGGITTAQTGRTLNLRGAGNGKISGIISGGAGMSVRLQGSGTWELSAANTYSGQTSIAGAGTIQLTHNLALQNSPFNADVSGGGTLDVSGVNTPTFGGLTGSTNFTLPANVTQLTLNNNTGAGLAYSGALGGGTGLELVKTGANTQTLSGVNLHAGTTTVSGGVLILGGNQALGSTAAGTVVNGGYALRLSGGVTVTGETIWIAGNGGAASAGNYNGALQADAGATAEWAGPVLLTSADARVGATAGGTLKISGAISDAGGTVLNVGAGTGGTGAVLISAPAGTNTYTGNTTITRGTLMIGADNTLPTGTVLDIDTANAGEHSILDLNGFNQTVGGLQRTNAGGGAGGSFVTNNGSADGALTVNQAGSSSYNGVIQDGTTHKTLLVKDGLGTLTLEGANTYTGTTTVESGTLLINGSTYADGLITVSALGTLGGSGSGGDVTVDDDGTLAPGTATVNQFQVRNLLLGSASVFAVELDAPDPGFSASNDYLDVLEDLRLDGVLKVTQRPGFGTPVLDDRWLIMGVAGTITNNGMTVDPSLVAPSGLYYAIETDTSMPGSSKVYLTVVPEPATAGLLATGLLLIAIRYRRKNT